MTQSLERAGDHAKNLAEEVCHLSAGAASATCSWPTTNQKETDVYRMAAGTKTKKGSNYTAVFSALLENPSNRAPAKYPV